MIDDDHINLLDDYHTGVLSDEAATEFEELLFAEAAQGKSTAAALVDDWGAMIRFLARYGPIGRSATASGLAELRAHGIRIHQHDIHPNKPNVFERWSDDIELVVTRLDVDVRGADVVDVIVERSDGTHLKTFHDVGYDPVDGSIYALCEPSVASLALLSGRTNARVVIETDGQRRELALINAEPGR